MGSFLLRCRGMLPTSFLISRSEVSNDAASFIYNSHLKDYVIFYNPTILINKLRWYWELLYARIVNSYEFVYCAVIQHYCENLYAGSIAKTITVYC